MKLKLTKRTIDGLACPAGRKDRLFFDSEIGGFGIRVTDKGRRSWLVQYRTAGLVRRMVIGDANVVPPDQARERAKATLGLVASGRDPFAEEREAKAEAKRQAEEAPASTYERAVNAYINLYQKREKGNVSADEVKRVLLREGAAWKTRPVADITPREVRRLLETIRDGKTSDDGEEIERPRRYLANRCSAYLRTFFAWCAEPGNEYVTRSPCEGLRRPWSGEKERERVLTDDELAAVWQGAGELDQHRAGFMRVLILLGKRKRALAAMRHEDIGEDGVWAPPKGSQNKRTHATPLPAKALQIIADLPRLEKNPHVFTGRRTGDHLDPGSVFQRAVQEKSGVGDFYFHAVRHTVETRLAEIGVLPHLRDMLLDHAPTRGAGKGYDHHTYRSEMRSALTAWARYIELIIDDKTRPLVAGALRTGDDEAADLFRRAIQADAATWERYVAALKGDPCGDNVVPLQALA